MKKIKLAYMGKVVEFTITYECPQYIFCECETHPQNRGFFTTAYINDNKA